MVSQVEADAEDVNDFLLRIKELGQKRDQEDEERNRKLEEEILQGRKERQARREERARSISPTKSSPANTPPHNPYRRSMVVDNSPRFQAKNDLILSPSRQNTLDDALDCSVDSPPTKENESNVPTLSRSTKPGDTFETVTMQNRDSNPTSPVRELSWQRRPKSQASDRPRSRPLSQLATENASAARSSVSTPNRSPTDDATFSRDQIANSLGSKDPSFFRQTADRGVSSAAYRKNQVEDSEVAEHSAGAQLPGMSRKESETNGGTGSGEVSPTRGSPVRHSRSKTISGISNLDGPTGTRSPMPMSPAQRLDPPGSDTTSTSDRGELSAVRERTLAMSPTQGRISPGKSDRPMSPTKGMGGFVQSAMMKRSDSVNKRWSAQSPQGLMRGDSIASNRSSYHPSTSSSFGGELLTSPSMREPNSLSRDYTPRPLSRPTSSYGGSNATVIQHDIERTGTPGSVKSSIETSDGFTKPARPSSRSIINSAGTSKEDLSLKTDGSKAELPSSPSRTMDPKRWSPTKASWLESALNKPDPVPKPKTVAAPSQPSWMAEIAKARQKSVDLGASRNQAQAPKHEVNIGGLMRSPAMGVTTKPLSLGGLPQNFNTTSLRSPEAISKGVLSPSKTGGGLAGQADSHGTLRPTSSSSRTDRPTSSSSVLSNTGSTAQSSALQSPDLNKSPSPVLDKVKPETPPKKDFRSNLKPRQPPPPSSDKNDPEFKNVFGQLKRTKTQNYVAPDELKDNILRGKSALNATGGPKKTERVDEFRQSILQKKKDFEKAQMEGKGVARSSSVGSKDDTVPEAIAKRQTLALEKEKSPPPSTPPKPASLGTTERSTPEALIKARAMRGDASKPATPTPQKDASAPGRLQAGGKLADRFNPALAGLLARGPPSASSETSRATSDSSRRTTSMGTSADMETEKPGPKLEHITKGRARGPRRKAPSSLKKSDESENNVGTSILSDATDATTTNVEIANGVKNPDGFDGTMQAETVKEPAKTMPGKTEEVAPPEAVSTTSQPSSPRKRTMTINRRSRYLEELANKNEKVPEPTTPRSPIKKLNLEDIFQAPTSPTKEPVKSPVRKLNHEFLPKSPTKSLPEKKEDEPAAEVKTNLISNSNISTSTTLMEKPMAPPKSPELTKNALEGTVKLNPKSESNASKPEIGSKPIGLSTSSIQERKPENMQAPAVARPSPPPSNATKPVPEKQPDVKPRPTSTRPLPTPPTPATKSETPRENKSAPPQKPATDPAPQPSKNISQSVPEKQPENVQKPAPYTAAAPAPAGAVPSWRDKLQQNKQPVTTRAPSPSTQSNTAPATGYRSLRDRLSQEKPSEPAQSPVSSARTFTTQTAAASTKPVTAPTSGVRSLRDNLQPAKQVETSQAPAASAQLDGAPPGGFKSLREKIQFMQQQKDAAQKPSVTASTPTRVSQPSPEKKPDAVQKPEPTVPAPVTPKPVQEKKPEIAQKQTLDVAAPKASQPTQKKPEAISKPTPNAPSPAISQPVQEKKPDVISKPTPPAPISKSQPAPEKKEDVVQKPAPTLPDPPQPSQAKEPEPVQKPASINPAPAQPTPVKKPDVSEKPMPSTPAPAPAIQEKKPGIVQKPTPSTPAPARPVQEKKPDISEKPIPSTLAPAQSIQEKKPDVVQKPTPSTLAPAQSIQEKKPDVVQKPTPSTLAPTQSIQEKTPDVVQKPTPSIPVPLQPLQEKKPDIVQKPTPSIPVPTQHIGEKKPDVVQKLAPSTPVPPQPIPEKEPDASPQSIPDEPVVPAQPLQEKKSTSMFSLPSFMRASPPPAAVPKPSEENKPDAAQAEAATRPLPNPPAPINVAGANSYLSGWVSKAVKSTTASLSSGSPPKKTVSSVPQSSEASKLLRDFFGEPTSPPPKYEIDTASVLTTKIATETPTVKTHSCQLYQLSPGGKKTLVPESLQKTLFEGNLYICVHTFKSPSAYFKSTEVYFWIGHEVPDSVVQDAEVFATKEAKAAGGKLFFLYQGKESSIFLQALGGVVITRRGTSIKHDSLAPFVLCGRQYLGALAFDEVDFSPNSFCSGFPYIVNTQSAKIWLWKGKGSATAEINTARAVGMELGVMGDIGEVDEGSESDEFLKAFGPGKIRIRGGADHWKMKTKYPGYCARLFKIGLGKATEISPFTQKSISPHNIWVLDAFFEIYIIIGAHSGAIYPGASATAYGGGASPASGDGENQGNQFQAFQTALHFAQEYGILAAGMEDRPFVPVSTVVVEGMPRDARVVVRKWTDDVITTRNPDNVPSNSLKSPITPGGGTLQRGRSLRVVPLMAALEATSR